MWKPSCILERLLFQARRACPEHHHSWVSILEWPLPMATELIAAPPRGCEPRDPGGRPAPGARKTLPRGAPLHPEPPLDSLQVLPAASLGQRCSAAVSAHLLACPRAEVLGRGPQPGAGVLGRRGPRPREGSAPQGGVLDSGEDARTRLLVSRPSPAVELPHAVQLRGLGPRQDHLPRQLHGGGPAGRRPRVAR